MSRRIHPIDDAFRSKLEHYASDTPEYVWQGIKRQRALRQRVYNRWRERTLLAASILLFLFAGIWSWQLRQQPPKLSTFPIALAGVLPPESCDECIDTLNIASVNSTASTASSRFLKTVAPLPKAPMRVQSLNEQFAETMQKWSEETNVPTSAISLSVLQMTALPLALHRNNRMKDLPFNLSKCGGFDNREKMRFYFDMLASPDFTTRKIEPRTSNYNDYANDRETTEKARYNYSLSARLSAVTGSGLAIRSGVNYSEIKERFEFAKENEERMVIRKIKDMNGTVIKLDTTFETYTRQLVTNNTYRTLDIPILLGYEKQFKKVTLTANGGAYVNILFKQKGEFLSPFDNQPVSFSHAENPADPPAFRNKLGIGWYGSVGMNYKISPSLHLMIEPHLKMYPRSFTSDQFMTDQRYLTAGIFVGLRHQFAL